MSKQQQKAEWDPGLEYLDPTPVAIPVGANRPESLQETMRRLVRNELSAAASSAGLETFEESIDFDIDDPEEAEHISMYEQAAQMHDELLEGQAFEQAERVRLQRESRGKQQPGDGGVSDRQRPGRAGPSDLRDGADDGGDEGSNRGVEVSGDRGTTVGPPDLRGKGQRSKASDGADSAR